jgi:hypothetical protein
VPFEMFNTESFVLALAYTLLRTKNEAKSTAKQAWQQA